MFYSHQLLARKAPLGQIWMAATMHAKMNRKKLNKLNIIKICEQILNPSVPMALRLSGILMGGVVIVYERKVKLLYDDVTRLLIEINEAWKIKELPDATILPKGKSKAKKETITLPENKETDFGDIGQFLYSTTSASIGFENTAFINVKLDSVNEPYIGKEDEYFHQADADNITLFEPVGPSQTDTYPWDRFERFDIEGDEEGNPNFNLGENINMKTNKTPSPPPHNDPLRADMIQDQNLEQNSNPQFDKQFEAKQNQGRQGAARRKRRPPAFIMDNEQIIIPGHVYQSWLKSASGIVSRRGRKRKPISLMLTRKIAKLMELPPTVLIDDLFSSGKEEIYYPEPLLEQWRVSNQSPQNSPPERPPRSMLEEPSLSSQLGPFYQDFAGFPFGDVHGGVDSQSLKTPIESQRPNFANDTGLINELTNIMNTVSWVPEASQMVTPRNSGDNMAPSLKSKSDRGSASHDSEVGSGRSNKKRQTNSSGGLEPVDENNPWQYDDAQFELERVSEEGSMPEQDLLVETGPTQTQRKSTSIYVDKWTNEIKKQMKTYFDTPGAPEVESLDLLAAGMDRRTAAKLFYQICVLASLYVLRIEQKVPYGEILISKGVNL